MGLILFLIWVGLAIAVGVTAKRYFNREAAWWTIWAILLSPLLAGLILYAVGEKPDAKTIDWRAINWSQRPRAMVASKPLSPRPPRPPRSPGEASPVAIGVAVAVVVGVVGLTTYFVIGGSFFSSKAPSTWKQGDIPWVIQQQVEQQKASR
jgi:hypothetical protein